MAGNRSLAADGNLHPFSFGGYRNWGTCAPIPCNLSHCDVEGFVFSRLRLGQFSRFNKLGAEIPVVYDNAVSALKAEVLHAYFGIQPLSAADYRIAPAVIAAEQSRSHIPDCRNITAGRVRKRQTVQCCDLLQRFKGIACISTALSQRTLRPFNYERYIHQRILRCRLRKVIQLPVIAAAGQVVGNKCLQPLFSCVGIDASALIMGKAAAGFEEAQQSSDQVSVCLGKIRSCRVYAEGGQADNNLGGTLAVIAVSAFTVLRSG
ncbi:hypothetical protein D3C75_344070 [compost metagenome]